MGRGWSGDIGGKIHFKEKKSFHSLTFLFFWFVFFVFLAFIQTKMSPLLPVETCVQGLVIKQHSFLIARPVNV